MNTEPIDYEDSTRAAARAAERAVAEHRWYIEMRRMALASMNLDEAEATEAEASVTAAPERLN